jgi:hypothetical protein
VPAADSPGLVLLRSLTDAAGVGSTCRSGSAAVLFL